MRNWDAKLGLLMIVSLFILVPIVYGINFTPGIFFQGAGGGLVTFNQNFAAYTVLVGPNLFSGLVWGGNNYGSFRFDADTGVNMTITQIAERSITYDVATLLGGPVHTTVSYGSYGGPTQVTGADNMNYDESTGIATLTSTGAATITLFYGNISHSIREAGKGMANLFTLFAIICIFGALSEARSGFENGKLILYLIVMAVVMAIAAVISGWGY